MPSVNERLRDAEISHSVDLAQYSAGVVRRIIGLLNRSDADLLARLTVALDTLPAESFTVERLEFVLASVRSLNVQAYALVERELTEELRRFAEQEADYQYRLFNDALPAQVVTRVGVAQVSAAQVYTAAMARPFQGRLLREWAAGIEADRMVRVRDAVRMGYLQGETVSQMVRRIRGTRANGYADGLLEIDRRGAEAVVRTAVSHMAGSTRDSFYAANSDIIAAQVWSSTLDLRTSPYCRVRDGKRYTVGEKPKPIGHMIPWCGERGCGPGRLHWRCRSTSTPVTKSWRELGIPIDELSPSTRASMDGQVPAETTFSEWLKKQSAARQDQVVGATRGKLMREGGVPFDAFYSDRGQFLTLEQLAERNAGAFKRSGVALPA